MIILYVNELHKCSNASTTARTLDVRVRSRFLGQRVKSSSVYNLRTKSSAGRQLIDTDCTVTLR